VSPEGGAWSPKGKDPGSLRAIEGCLDMSTNREERRGEEGSMTDSAGVSSPLSPLIPAQAPCIWDGGGV
jgi:hypothetical protein